MTVFVFQPNGTFIRAFGKRGDVRGRFASPVSLVFDFSGNLLVVDQRNHRCCLFNSRDEVILCFGSSGLTDGHLLSPNWVTTDNDGNYLVSDDAHRVQTFNPSGEWMRTIGGKGAEPGRFSYPVGLAVNLAGDLAVCE